jgi:CheY-like chemotaxis protein
MKSILKSAENIELSIADSAEAALISIDKKIPDLILLDIDLPGINGYELFERLQAESNLKKIPVIAVTASAMATDMEKAKMTNFSAYLTKPLIIDDLFRAINSALNQDL